jgi:anti-sigma-K factor RskA
MEEHRGAERSREGHRGEGQRRVERRGAERSREERDTEEKRQTDSPLATSTSYIGTDMTATTVTATNETSSNTKTTNNSVCSLTNENRRADIAIRFDGKCDRRRGRSCRNACGTGTSSIVSLLDTTLYLIVASHYICSSSAQQRTQ